MIHPVRGLSLRALRLSASERFALRSAAKRATGTFYRSAVASRSACSLQIHRRNTDFRKPLIDPDFAVTDHPPASPDIPVSTVCSNDDSAHMGGSIVSASVLNVQLVNGDGSVACDFQDTDLRAIIINERNVKLPGDLAPNCPTLARGLA